MRGRVRSMTEKDLSVSAARLVGKADAAGWSTVAVVSTGDDGAEVLSVRGARGRDARFVVLFVDGGYSAGWWLTRQHRSIVKGYRRQDRWTKQKYAGRVWYAGTAVEVLEPKLLHDPELDEVVEWTSDLPSWERLSSLSALVGVASRGVPGLLTQL